MTDYLKKHKNSLIVMNPIQYYIQYNTQLLSMLIQYKPMANRAITINQTYQPRLPSKHLLNKPNEVFPDPIPTNQQSINRLKSIATVLAQALSTRDHTASRQLLISASPQIIANSVGQIPINRVGSLLETIELILIEQNKSTNNMEMVTTWLRQILKKYIGQIINNPQLQIICGRINRLIKKRQQISQKLSSLYQKIHRKQISTASEYIYKPKFHYIEQQNEIQHKDEQENLDKNGEGESGLSNLGEEDFQNIDEMMDDDIDF